MKTGVTICTGFALLGSLSLAAGADPLPGESLLFSQPPMVQTNIFGQVYFGHDEFSTAARQPVGAPFDVYAGPFMADDFALKSAQAITHLKVWGSFGGFA